MNYHADDLLEEKIEDEIASEKMEEEIEFSFLKKFALYMKQDDEMPYFEFRDETEANSLLSAARIFWARMSEAWKAEWKPEDLLEFIEQY